MIFFKSKINHFPPPGANFLLFYRMPHRIYYLIKKKNWWVRGGGKKVMAIFLIFFRFFSHFFNLFSIFLAFYLFVLQYKVHMLSSKMTIKNYETACMLHKMHLNSRNWKFYFLQIFIYTAIFLWIQGNRACRIRISTWEIIKRRLHKMHLNSRNSKFHFFKYSYMKSLFSRIYTNCACRVRI